MINSPQMTVRYAYLRTPSTTYKENGEYSIKCAIQDGTAEADAFKARLEALIEAKKAEATKELNPAQKKRLSVVKPWIAEEDQETGEDTGMIVFNFKMPAQVTRKRDGKVFKFMPDLFDSAGNVLPEDIDILGGAIVEVGFTADRVYLQEVQDDEGKKRHRLGLSSDLKAVMLLEQGSGGRGGTAESYGFTKKSNGFVAPSAKSPFDTEDTQEPDGDF